MSSWNGQDLAKETPSLGFTLSSAQLIPGFVEQALALDLFARVEDTQITPLDDLKEWMRQDPYRTGDLVGQVHGLLLGEEDKARAAAEKAGAKFDVVGYELEEMESDPTYEAFNAEWTGLILKLLIEEADSLQAWSKRENGLDLAMAVSFQLPDPRKHPRFSLEQIVQALAAHGAKPEALAPMAKGRKASVELSGAFQIDFSAPGGGPRYERKNGVGFVKVPCADPRAGDECVAHLSLAYPLEAEGYFLLTFDELRKTLTLKNAEDGD